MDTVTLGYNAYTLDDAEDAADWTSVGSNTDAVDATNYQRGAGSIKLTIDAGSAANTIISYNTTPSNLDISQYDTVLFWFRCDASLSAGDLQFGFDNDAAMASPDKLINIPAYTTASTPPWVRVALTAQDLSGITSLSSFGIKMVTDIGNKIVWLDDIVLCNSKSFNLLWQRGLDDPEDLYDWPGSATTLLDGSTSYKNTRFGRNVTLSLFTITAIADRVWLAKAMSHITNGSIRIIYANDEVEGVKNQSGHSLYWMGDFEQTQACIISVREKTPLWSTSRTPPSWV